MYWCLKIDINYREFRLSVDSVRQKYLSVQFSYDLNRIIIKKYFTS